MAAADIFLRSEQVDSIVLSAFFFAVPARTLLAALSLCVAAVGATIWFALTPPWLGLELEAGADGTVQAAGRVGGPAAVLGRDAGGLTLAGPSHPQGLLLQAEDLIEEPDFFDEFSQMNAFFERQSVLHGLLQEPVQATWRNADGTPMQATLIAQRRPLGSLPPPFWFQIAVSCAGFLIACWVWALRPADWGARMFALTGISFPIFALPAAIYSTRELALPGEMFRTLAALNHAGAFMFGCALMALFLCYPRRLLAPAWLLLLPLIYGLWWVADVLQIVPDQNWVRVGILSEMLGAIGLAGVQWWRSRGSPIDRATLRWLALSTLVGSGLFVFSTVGSSLLGLFPPLSQGYAFGYFLIIYVGLAFGLRRYRLFDLDRWAYRILLWLAAALTVVLMDAAWIVWLRLDPALSLGVTLLICGWLYFPFRQWLWQRLTGEQHTRVEDVFPELIRIAFSTSRQEQETRWDQLLARLYDPLDIRRASAAPASQAVCLSDSGQVLHLPACGGVTARSLNLAARGRRLFALRDVELATSLVSLMNHAAAGRDAYERGANEERVRITQDMHDDIGARLLMLIHQAVYNKDEASAEVARAAMGDLRTTLSALDGQDMSLADALADWRAEMSSRCEAGRVAFSWLVAQQLETRLQSVSGTDDLRLSARAKAALERSLREALSNALKHAAPTRVTLQVQLDAGCLKLSVSDDGQPAQAADAPSRPTVFAGSGRGLAGLRRRLAEFDGLIELERSDDGSRLTIMMPLTGAAISEPAHRRGGNLELSEAT